MYLDKDSWGKFSINDLDEKELCIIHEAIKAYARCNFGNIHPKDCARMLSFDGEFNNIIGNGKQTLDKSGR